MKYAVRIILLNAINPCGNCSFPGFGIHDSSHVHMLSKGHFPVILLRDWFQ